VDGRAEDLNGGADGGFFIPLYIQAITGRPTAKVVDIAEGLFRQSRELAPRL